jgi:hypothetical protein
MTGTSILPKIIGHGADMSDNTNSVPSTGKAEFDSHKIDSMLTALPSGHKLTMVKVGSDERPASSEDIQGIQAAFAQADGHPDVSIVTHHAINVESYTKDCHGQLVRLDPAKFQKHLIVLHCADSEDNKASELEAKIQKKLDDIGIVAAVISVPHGTVVQQFEMGA